MHFLGLDIGTSSLKFTLLNEQQQLIYEGEYVYHDDMNVEGYREIDPNVWYHHALRALREIYEKNPKVTIDVIGITGQMHTTVFLDDRGNCVRPAIMWNDTRCASWIPFLKQELKNHEETKYIARIISTGSPFTNILWVKENEPNNFQRIHKVMSASAYLIYKLTGCFSCDYCDASTSSMYDIVNKKWSSYMLNYLQIDANYFGTLHASCDIIGEVKKSICQSLHIINTIQVIAGTGDNPATAVAMGILENHDVPVISLGTSGVVLLSKDDGDYDGKGKTVLLKTDTEEIFHIVQGVVQSAGGTHKWWIENIMKSKDMAMDQSNIDQHNLGNNKVMFFPHIAGDKTVYQDPNVRGAFVGLCSSTKREDMLQAILEGIGYSLKEVLESLNGKYPQTIRISGGGTKSMLWMQIIANILGVKLVISHISATPGYGICLLAMKAIKQPLHVYHNQEVSYITPNRTIQLRYQQQYKRYQRFYNSLKAMDG